MLTSAKRNMDVGPGNYAQVWCWLAGAANLSRWTGSGSFHRPALIKDGSHLLMTRTVFDQFL